MARKIRHVLGIDIGTESVGSAWVDLDANDFEFAVSIFPRGVEERDDQRGAPKNQARRQARSQRKSIARRSARKRWLRHLLVDAGLYPLPNQPFDHDVHLQTPWELRRDGLRRPLTPHEFGRVLVHLNQRRGALGVAVDDKEDADGEKTKEVTDDKKAKEMGDVKRAIARLNEAIGDRTFGQFMADLYDERKHAVLDKRAIPKEKHYRIAIRNRRDALDRNEGFHATRDIIRKEFLALWDAQKKMPGPTAALLTDELKKLLDDPTEDAVWREKGIIFGQRKTYWDTGTLGRCDIEPSAHCCSHADMYVQEFRVLETVNNIRVKWADEEWRPLNEKERDKVIKALQSREKPRKQKTPKKAAKEPQSEKKGSPAKIREALEITKKQSPFFFMKLDNDPDREINTNWFYREIVLPVFGEGVWKAMCERERESVNRAILKFDPDTAEHAVKLAQGARNWWKLPEEKVQMLLEGWKTRPKLEKRVNLSRRALQNLLPLMRQRDPKTGRWPTLEEAKQCFAEDPSSSGTVEQRVRYAPRVTDALRELLCRLVGEERTKQLLKLRGTTKRDRHYMKKHPDKILPPAPMLANPVVRKAIHEVRRHVIAWIRKFGRKPDQIVVELISEARQSAKVRNKILARNRFREKTRKEIIKQSSLDGLSFNQQEAAVDRVLLCRQQRGVCAYTGDPISEQRAAQGTDLECDHIVPKSLTNEHGLNNRVLCYRNANQGKGQRTPKDWLTPDQYAAMLQVLRHLEKGDVEKGSYFSKKENARKWKNLTSDTPDMAEFLASQYTDTAYAAKQVREWLTGILYGEEQDAADRVLPTNGRVTSALRKDWQLQDSDKPKDRGDHRQHALDALVIALSDLHRQGVLESLAEQERFHEKRGQWVKREPVDPPWGKVKEFSAQVMKKLRQAIVAHRPVKRRIIGKLHKDNPLGKSREYHGLYKSKISARELTPAQLRPPKKNVAKDGTITYSIQGRGQGSVVRDPELRKAIRRCLLKTGIDPDNFTEKEIKRITDPENYGLCHPSGVPIYNVTVVRTLTVAVHGVRN